MLLCSSQSYAAGQADLDYEVRLEGRELAVDLRFLLPAAGPHTIVLPSSYGGFDDFWQWVSEPQVIGGGSLDVGEKPFLRVLRTAGPARVHLRYRVRTLAGEITRELCYRPIVTSSYMHVLGNAWVVRPHWPDQEKRSIALRWRLPEGWAVANSFGAGERQQRFQASLRELQYALYLAGDFRLLRSEIRGRPLVLALRGAFGSSDADFRNTTARIVGAQRRLWEDDDFPFYFVSILPIDIPMGHTTGIGRTNGFAAFLAPGRKIDDAVLHVLAHELLHTWIPGLSPDLYWFTEGFTDYFANTLLVLEGLEPFDWLVSTVNEKLRRYAGNPARNWPNTRAGKEYHRDRDAGALAYLRGMFVALNWNAAIRAASHDQASLTGAMRRVRRQSKVIDAAAIAEAVGHFGAAGAAADIQRWIDKGETVQLRPDALGPCAELLGETFRTRAEIGGQDCANWFR